MKTIVTHKSPDLDAATSLWLVKSFLPGWSEAPLQFVPAGTTLNNKGPDENPDIIHVDTGYGAFDHHQTDEFTSASKKVLDFLMKEGHVKETNRESLERLVAFVTDDDHFMEVYYPEPEADRYDLLLSNLVRGLKMMYDDHEVVAIVFHLLDAGLRLLESKVKAEKEVKLGYIFTSYVGKSIALESANEATIGLAQKMGYKLVARKDPKAGHIRIKTPPDPGCDLTPLYQKIIKHDKIGTWFLHASKHMLLNGSPKRPDQKPSPLTIQKLIEIIKEI